MLFNNILLNYYINKNLIDVYDKENNIIKLMTEEKFIKY